MTLSASTMPDIPKMTLDTAYEYCNVSQKVKGAVDSAGEATWTWTAVDSNIKADFQPLTEWERQRASAGIERASTHRGFFESTVLFPALWDNETEEPDLRIEMDSSGDGTVDTYFLIVAVDDHASHIEVLARKTSSDA